MAIQERNIVNIYAIDSAGNLNVPCLLSTATVYTQTVDFGDCCGLAGVLVSCGTVTPTGTSRITLSVEQGPMLPAIEGSASPIFFSTSNCMITGGAGLVSFNAISLSARYVRLKGVVATPNQSSQYSAIFQKQVQG